MSQCGGGFEVGVGAADPFDQSEAVGERMHLWLSVAATDDPLPGMHCIHGV
jgi:hypothetical protein